MKVHFLKIIFFLSVTACAQTDLGIGLVAINFNEKTVLKFYSSPTETTETKSITFFNDKTINSINIQNLKEQQKWLKPESLWLDNSLFILRCKKHKKDWYEIIANNENGKSYWIRKSDITEFSSWEKYLKNMFSIARLTREKQSIKKLPNSSEVIKFSGEDCFQIKAIQNDWIEIFTADHCEETKTKLKSGWIKWRSGNKLLIEYFHTS